MFRRSSSYIISCFQLLLPMLQLKETYIPNFAFGTYIQILFKTSYFLILCLYHGEHCL